LTEPKVPLIKVVPNKRLKLEFGAMRDLAIVAFGVALLVGLRAGANLSAIDWTLLVVAVATVLVVLAILRLAFEEQAQNRNRNSNRPDN